MRIRVRQYETGGGLFGGPRDLGPRLVVLDDVIGAITEAQLGVLKMKSEGTTADPESALKVLKDVFEELQTAPLTDRF